MRPLGALGAWAMLGFPLGFSQAFLCPTPLTPVSIPLAPLEVGTVPYPCTRRGLIMAAAVPAAPITQAPGPTQTHKPWSWAPNKGETAVFCNREINMKTIKAVGFDMDYTLAQYNEAFERLAYEGAKQKLVNMFHYPRKVWILVASTNRAATRLAVESLCYAQAAVLNFEYDPGLFRPGLVIDKERGNIIKMDRYKYVRIAYHGFHELPTHERKHLYKSSLEKMTTFTEENYVSLDTLFLLVDACLFAQLVDYKDSHPGSISQSYKEIYTDIRKSVDLCHRDGVIKDRVAEDPEAYIIQDPGVVKMLRQYRASGRKTFLVTNSLWEYTHVVMNFLTGNAKREDFTLDWLELFDVIIVGSNKPRFLMDTHLNMLRVDPHSGALWNTDGVEKPLDKFLAKGKVFQGGNYRHLNEILGITAGEEVLYVGDHMYSDVLKSKRDLGWRTCLIVPEVAEELGLLQQFYKEDQKFDLAASEQLALDEEIDQIFNALQMTEDPAHKASLEAELAILFERGEKLNEDNKEECWAYHRLFHPTWGKIFETGFKQSRFGVQVSAYACIYTAKASNLGLVSPERWFRPARDRMPHDSILDLVTTYSYNERSPQ